MTFRRLWDRWNPSRPSAHSTSHKGGGVTSLGETTVTRVFETEECLVVGLSGLMGNGDPRPLRKYLARLGVKSTKSVLLDLSEVTHIWPVAIGMLMNLKRCLNERRKCLTLTNVGQNVLDALEIEGAKDSFVFVQRLRE